MTSGAVVGLIVAFVMLIPIGYDKFVVKTQVEPVIQTEEILEVSSAGTLLVTGLLVGESHLTFATIATGLVLALVLGAAAGLITHRAAGSRSASRIQRLLLTKAARGLLVSVASSQLSRWAAPSSAASCWLHSS